MDAPELIQLDGWNLCQGKRRPWKLEVKREGLDNSHKIWRWN